MKFMKLGSKSESFQTDGNDVRFLATELPTDVVISVGDMKFYLHKFPLLSKCARLQKLVASTNDESDGDIHISDIPGGAAAFEVCAKFCYGMTVTLNAYNVVAVRCAAEYLEMHETVEKGNLIFKIEVFLKSSIFRSWKDSIIVLQTMKSFLPWTEDLKLVNLCIDCIASKATMDTSEVEWSYTYNRRKLPSENGLDPNWNGVRKQQLVPKDWWVEDICELEMDFYKRVIIAIRTKDTVPREVIGEAIKAYVYRRLPGFSKGTLTIHDSDIMKYQVMVETIVWLLPAGKGVVSCSFLLRLLRAGNLLDCSEVAKRELIKRAGNQLEQASVTDLLIPAPEGDSLIYDIDIILSIVEEFTTQAGNTSPQIMEEVLEVKSASSVTNGSKLAVAKIVDGCLAEVSRDPNLPLSRFIDLAELVSADSRPVHDGLYRAIDMYLKEHPYLSKSEKKKICGLMDCKKLSMDACMHAVQNERLPLRVVVQILFFEQVRASATGNAANLPESVRSLLPRENGGSYGSSRSAPTTNTEDDWDAIPRGEDIKSLKTLKLHGNVGGGESGRSSVSSEAHRNGDDRSNGKVKGMMRPKKILRKLWSGKGHGVDQNSSSDTSESPSSSNQEEIKSTSSRNIRHSVS